MKWPRRCYTDPELSADILDDFNKPEVESHPSALFATFWIKKSQSKKLGAQSDNKWLK
jgi:hypothetical protein